MDLEEEIRAELERLEQIFGTEGTAEPATAAKNRPGRLSYTAYEYAEAEGEKEALVDKLHQLESTTEDWSAQIAFVSRVNAELQSRIAQLAAENDELRGNGSKSEVTDVPDLCTPVDQLMEAKGAENSGGLNRDGGFVSIGAISEGSLALELLLAETRSKLVRVQAAYNDMVLVKDEALRELERERMLRIHVG
jgi:chromosome segregation ATPase